MKIGKRKSIILTSVILLCAMGGVVLGIYLFGDISHRDLSRAIERINMKTQRQKEYAEGLTRANKIGVMGKDENQEGDEFTWKDDLAQLYWDGGNHIAAMFLRRIEFYLIPAGVEAWTEERWLDDYNVSNPRKFANGGIPPPFTGRLNFIKDGNPIILQPHKIINFTKNIHVLAHALPVHGAVRTCLLFGTDVLRPYAIKPRTVKERGLLNRYKERTGKEREWHSERGDYDEFYGMFRVDGTLIFQLDEKSKVPNEIIFPWHAMDDCSLAAIAIGRGAVIHGEHGSYLTVAGVKEVYIWSPQDGLKRISISNAISKYPLFKYFPSFQFITSEGGQVGDSAEPSYIELVP